MAGVSTAPTTPIRRRPIHGGLATRRALGAPSASHVLVCLLSGVVDKAPEGDGRLEEGLGDQPPRGDQRFGLVTLAGPRRAFEADERSRLTMLSYCFHQRLRNLAPKHGFAFPPVGLTRREIDVLRLIARGATDRGVARKLGISPSTAHEHLENAKRKLNVSTRAEAIAIAVSLAIVVP